jgi:hypothetical protein
MRQHPAQQWSRPDSYNSPREAGDKVSPYSQRLCVQAFLVFLEERRALYAPGARLKEDDTIISVQKIVEECEWCLARLEEQSRAAVFIRDIATVCRSFAAQSAFPSSAEFYMTLGALRLFFADMIAKLSLAYDVSGTLPAISIMPARDQGGAAHEVGSSSGRG